MSGGEGGSWSAQDMRLGSELNQLVSYRPLVAYKILTLLSIAEMGGLPQVKIKLNDETVIEGDFDGVFFERGSFKLDIHMTNSENIKIESLLINEISVIDTNSEHITEQSISKALSLELEIKNYFKENKA